MGAADLKAHVLQLCAEHGIEWDWCPPFEASAGDKALHVYIPPIRNQVHYMIALHEIGHLVGRGRSKPMLESEVAAWQYALDTSIVEPHPGVYRHILRCLDGYYWKAVRDERCRPPGATPAYWEFTYYLKETGCCHLI